MFNLMIVDFLNMQPIEQSIVIILLSSVISAPIGLLLTQWEGK